MQRKIVLSHSILQEVERLQENNKISAIKLVRKHGKAYPAAEGHNEPHSVGLREAKEAVEHAYRPSHLDNRTPCAVFGAGFRVKKLLVEIAGEGEIELDVEGLQMRFLQELETLGLPQVQHLLELTGYIEEWQR